MPCSSFYRIHYGAYLSDLHRVHNKTDKRMKSEELEQRNEKKLK